MKTFITDFLKLESLWSITLYIFLVLFVAWIISRIVRFIVVQIIKARRKEAFANTSIQFFKNS